MKITEIGNSDSPSLGETQIGNRVKRKRGPNQKSTKPNPYANSLSNEKSPHPHHKYKYKRFKCSESEKRFSALKGALLTGKAVSFELFPELSKCFEENNLEALFKFERPDFFYGLVGEFYCNLESSTDSGGNLELKTLVAGQTIVLNELLVCRALNLSTKMLDFPKLSSQFFAFNKADFHSILESLSGQSVPSGHFESEIFTSAEFLLPPAQFIALILRTNFLPRFGSEKLFTFSELKVIHHLLKNSLQLNVPHLILTHIEASNQANSMVFGILLTAIFKYHKIPLGEHTFSTANSFIHGRNIAPPIPLSESLLVNAHSIDKAITQIVLDESVQKLFNQMEENFEKKNQELREKVEALDKKIEKFSAGKARAVEPSSDGLLVTTLGDLQSKVYMLEQLYLGATGNEGKGSQNPNSDLNRLHTLASECEMLTENDRNVINIYDENGQSSQLIGSSTSLPLVTMNFEPSPFQSIQ